MSHAADPGDLAGRAARALGDPRLQRAVRFTADRLRDAKAAATASLGGFAEWRERGREIRAHTIANVDHYLRLFARNLAARGGRVHFAADAREACALVTEIARQGGARRVVKGKSMVSEEIGLNAHLAAQGLEVVETDLGEWIVQLAGETPSHIILPAIHKTRGEIQELFERESGARLAPDTATLAGHARGRLRTRFLAADLGVSGCNFAVAETGSVVLFTNEGNGRLVAALPRVHVVLMGLERVVPTWQDLECMAQVLPRSATGQPLTTYVNAIHGPRRAGEADGPEELHVVVVDNGRSRQLGDPEFQAILHCIRCGACLNVCPVYRQIGGHAYGAVYPGPIGAVLNPLLEPDRPARTELAQASSLCGACSEACPVAIPLHDMLVALRARDVRHGRGGPGLRLALRLLAWLARHPRLARPLLRLGRTLARLPGVRALGPARAWRRIHAPLVPAPRSFLDQWHAGTGRDEVQHGP
ncbi:MAG: iron-sulfur cluster-binding protein [Planctomycetes bacterium]|nr:iron-sulfur cluster-binding protein [Planctomycetota bacterium]